MRLKLVYPSITKQGKVHNCKLLIERLCSTLFNAVAQVQNANLSFHLRYCPKISRKHIRPHHISNLIHVFIY